MAVDGKKGFEMDLRGVTVDESLMGLVAETTIAVRGKLGSFEKGLAEFGRGIRLIKKTVKVVADEMFEGWRLRNDGRGSVSHSLDNSHWHNL